MPIDHQRIHDNGWLQGSTFTLADSTHLLTDAHWQPLPDGFTLLPETRLVVVSHSCDVVSQNPLERHVEVCPACGLPEGSTLEQFGYARDPRRLRLPIVVNGQQRLHELWAPLRFSLERALLEGLVPDQTVAIDSDALEHLTYWLSARVRRRTFPNALDQRIGTNSHKRIRKALSKVEHQVEALLYSLSTERELEPGASYRLRIVLLAKHEALDDPATFDLLEEARDKIEEILSGKEGVEIDVVDLASDGSISVAAASTYSNWGFEDLSLEPDDD